MVVIDDGSEETVVDKHTETVVEQGSTSVVGELEISSEVISASSENIATLESEKNNKILATPVARKLAKDLNVDIKSIEGTGPAGRVMKADIYAASEKTINQTKAIEQERIAPLDNQSVSESQSIEYVPLSNLRKTISKNMTLSKFTIPHYSCYG